MVMEWINPEFIRNVIENPVGSHWSQSHLERVTDAQVLLSGTDFVLTKTAYKAPRQMRHATYGTHFLGETNRREMLRHFSEDFIDSRAELQRSLKGVGRRLHFSPINPVEQVERYMRWAQEEIAKSYENGEFPHIDYTLWLRRPTIHAFVNLRVFPEDSYLVDRIFAEVRVFDKDGKPLSDKQGFPISDYSNDSYSSGSHETLRPEQRTKTLEALALENRLRGADVVIMDDGEEFIGKIQGNGQLGTFANADGIRVLYGFELPENIIEMFAIGDVKERYLQKVLSFFRIMLDEVGVKYRR